MTIYLQLKEGRVSFDPGLRVHHGGGVWWKKIKAGNWVLCAKVRDQGGANTRIQLTSSFNIQCGTPVLGMHCPHGSSYLINLK